MIVKVQRPLSVMPKPTGEVPCLVYPESRRAMVQQPVEPDVMAILLARPGGKAYFQAEWMADVQMYRIGRQVKDEDW